MSHINCPCWATGEFRWNDDCPEHIVEHPHQYSLAQLEYLKRREDKLRAALSRLREADRTSGIAACMRLNANLTERVAALMEALAPFANRCAEKGMGGKYSALTDSQWRRALETYQECPGGIANAPGVTDAQRPTIRSGRAEGDTEPGTLIDKTTFVALCLADSWFGSIIRSLCAGGYGQQVADGEWERLYDVLAGIDVLGKVEK